MPANQEWWEAALLRDLRESTFLQAISCPIANALDHAGYRFIPRRDGDPALVRREGQPGFQPIAAAILEVLGEEVAHHLRNLQAPPAPVATPSAQEIR